MKDEDIDKGIEEMLGDEPIPFKFMPRKWRKGRLEQYVLKEAYNDEEERLDDEQKSRLADLTYNLSLARTAIFTLAVPMLSASWGGFIFYNAKSTLDYVVGGSFFGGSVLQSLMGYSLSKHAFNKSKEIREEVNEEYQ